jgi:hypothetical protein
MNDDYLDLLETLRWGANLELTQDQRSSLRDLCSMICGIHMEARVPSWRLAEEAEKRRKAEHRVGELEAVLKAGRDEWVFRRKSGGRSGHKT